MRWKSPFTGCLDFDGGSSSKARLDTRISRSNNYRRIAFRLLLRQFLLLPAGDISLPLSARNRRNPTAKSHRHAGTVLALVHFAYVESYFERAILRKADDNKT
ncbi:hypothetical protein, partial [Mesorhizobium sp.]|uniref:hypothetical protein n=1 Tax=Mesorhizobium sp. TaxID=1871066 RepID=UPI002579EF9D